MQGLMMDRPLLISSLIRYAAEFHRDTEIVSRSVEGPIHRYTYADAERSSRYLAQGLEALGVGIGDRVATLAWNTWRHFELYFGVSGMGAVCHTLNPRLFAEQLIYIVNHAEDRILCTDLTFLPLVEKLLPQFKTVEHVIVMTDEAHMPDDVPDNYLCYETLLEGRSDDYQWPEFDEDAAASLCYTSGTTGNPKGALYSHRSTVLHSFACCMKDTLGMCSQSVVLPVVPMFHANAWGTPYSAAMTGAKMVFPGPGLDGASVYELVDQENVTALLGVPTVWLMLLEYLRAEGKRIDGVESVVIGGSAAPRAMIEAFENEFDVRVLHAWGMTELSPLGTVNTPRASELDLEQEERLKLQLKQGRGIYGVELRIIGPDGQPQPWDGESVGELECRGPWVSSAYFKNEGGDILHDGWFPTGDIACIDSNGYLQLTDRAKDVIKSGGEWISSIELENEAVSHPGVAEAAVIGIAHPKWDERPLLVVVPVGDFSDKASILEHLRGRVAKWWLPDDIQFVDELPHTATGKISKLELRTRFEDYEFPKGDN
ncbi:MAG: 3-(methylthio)propionyl-CoA ligase [Xanthomonadales bacterium]|nr:3-(methylthio)propionyl-CoA ligase [Xanthomonadales bacterium]